MVILEKYLNSWTVKQLNKETRRLKMEANLVKMSPKGQLVVSQDIRKKEGFSPGDRFVPFLVKGGVLFKKVEIPDVKAEF